MTAAGGPLAEVEVWPVSAAAADAFLFSTSQAFPVSVLDTRRAPAWEALAPQLEEFLARRMRAGSLLVKTSTTGDRSADCEVSSDLLGNVLRLAVSRLGRDRIVVGDGPAYARDYLTECRRLGWEPLLAATGVAVVDLNQDAAAEIAPGWPVSTTFLQAGGVINLCRAKTHRRFGVSLSGKSLLGVLSGAALGYPKLIGRHAAVPWLTREIERRAPPMFSIIEGNPGVDGEGPLRARPNGSHFMVFGEDCLAADVLATVEMGFDPILVPGLVRPAGRTVPEQEVCWSELRRTNTDFLPAAACSWLYRSLRKRRRREDEFRTLWDGIRSRWGAGDR